MRKLTLIAGLLLLLPVSTQAKTLEELLVEKGVITKNEARASQHSGAAKVYWNKGTTLDFADVGFTARINTLLQPRYEFTDNDEDAENNENESSFSLRSARLQVAGTALYEEFSYKLQVEFADYEGDGGQPELLDAYISWHACDWAELRLGQTKTAISRQFNTHRAKLQFADRSEVSDLFDLDRQAGLTAVGSFADDRLTLSAGIYNGESDGEGRNKPGVDTNHTGVVAARFDVLGSMNPFVEGDIDGTDELALNTGVAYAFSDAETLGGELDVNTLSADINLKSNGASFHGEFFWNEADLPGGADTEAVGAYAQVGYFVAPKEFEVALRYGILDCDSGDAGGVFGGACLIGEDVGADDVNVVDVSLNYYWWKHNLKAQLGYSFLNQDVPSGDEDINTNRWLLQLSSWF